MENAADALKMAFAILVFVIAITVTFMLVGQARQTSDMVLASIDKESYTEYSETDNIDNRYITSSGKRIVGKETIIPSLYRFWKEYYSVEICKQGSSDIKTLDLTEKKYNNTEAANQDIDNFLKDPTVVALLNGGRFEESFSRIRTSGEESVDSGPNGTGDSLIKYHGSIKTIIRYTRIN